MVAKLDLHGIRTMNGESSTLAIADGRYLMHGQLYRSWTFVVLGPYYIYECLFYVFIYFTYSEVAPS